MVWDHPQPVGLTQWTQWGYIVKRIYTPHETNQSMPKMWEEPQSTHRVAKATFCLHSITMVKSAQPVRVGGACPPLFTLSTITSIGLWCTLQLRGQIRSPYFISTPICAPWEEFILYFWTLLGYFWTPFTPEYDVHAYGAISTVFFWPHETSPIIWIGKPAPATQC